MDEKPPSPESPAVSTEAPAVSADAPAAGAEDTGDLVFEALWKRVNDAWDEDAPHAALLEHSIRTGRLPEVAGRYRLLKDDPVRGVKAKKRLDGVVMAATHLLYATKTPKPTKVPWPVTAVAGIVSAVLLFYLARMMLRLHH